MDTNPPRSPTPADPPAADEPAPEYPVMSSEPITVDQPQRKLMHLVLALIAVAVLSGVASGWTVYCVLAEHMEQRREVRNGDFAQVERELMSVRATMEAQRQAACDLARLLPTPADTRALARYMRDNRC